MATHYFVKYVPQIPINHGGKRVEFEQVGPGIGLLALDDAPINGDLLNKLLGLSEPGREKLGVKRLTQQEFEDIKKNPPKPQRNREQPSIQVLRPQSPFQSRPTHQPQPGQAVAPAAVPQPVANTFVPLQPVKPAKPVVTAQPKTSSDADGRSTFRPATAVKPIKSSE